MWGLLEVKRSNKVTKEIPVVLYKTRHVATYCPPALHSQTNTQGLPQDVTSQWQQEIEREREREWQKKCCPSMCVCGVCVVCVWGMGDCSCLSKTTALVWYVSKTTLYSLVPLAIFLGSTLCMLYSSEYGQGMTLSVWAERLIHVL